jgi:hypothetical protein
MPHNYDITTIKKAITGSCGYYQHIAKHLGCEWHTAKKYVEMYPETIQAYNNECELLLDLAESKLAENIKDNDNTAIIFYLKTKGKKRGYIERNEVEHSGEIKTNDLTGLTYDQLIELRNRKSSE